MARHFSPVIGHEEPGGFLQVSRPAVIPQSLPQFQAGVFICLGEGADIGKTLQKTGIISLYRLDTGLLQHDL